MTPQHQIHRHDPGNGIFGDCHHAAVASVLDLPIEAVPHFAYDMPDGVEFERRVDQFLRSRDLVSIRIIFDASEGLQPILDAVQHINPGTYFLLGGTSKSGCGHTVVCCDGEIIHDPHPDAVGIVGPMEDGFYWVTFFGTIVATRSV